LEERTFASHNQSNKKNIDFCRKITDLYLFRTLPYIKYLKKRMKRTLLSDEKVALQELSPGGMQEAENATSQSTVRGIND